MKTNKTKILNQREYSGDLTEEQLTKLLQEAYGEEIPALSEELLQKTLEKVKMAEQTSQEKSSVPTSFLRKWMSNVMVKRYVVVVTACMLLVVCGKIVQENGAFVEKGAAPEICKTETARNETSGSISFNGATSNNVGMMADSAQSITEQDGVTQEECADSLPQTENETTDTSAAEQIEQEVKIENGQTASKEENFGIDSTDGKVEKESIYESLAELLPMFPKELYGAEAIYELWIDGVQVESSWETYMEVALRHSSPQLLPLQQQSQELFPEADTRENDTFFSEQDILFTLVVSLEETKYCMDVGACTKVTIERNGEKRSAFFAILDLTLYEEIFTMKP